MINKVVHLLSGEWMLRSRPNGGTVIFLRALWVTTLVYSAAIGVEVLFSCPSGCSEALLLAGQAAQRSFLPFVAGTFAFAYTALYARFASQWSYLASLYNQIMEAKVSTGICPPKESSQSKDSSSGALAFVDADLDEQDSGTDSNRLRAIQKWQAGFIEDAEELHLATKPMFAGVIVSMLDCLGVRKRFITDVAGGEVRLRRLEKRVRLAFEEAAQRK